MNAPPPHIDARTMTDEEFEAANRAKAWRDRGPQAKAAPPASTKPPPPAPAERGPKPAMLLSEAEFEKANREKAWRKEPQK